jgi:di/tricarboxylate transporter
MSSEAAIVFTILGVAGVCFAPGSYRFVDFAKVGIPLLVLTWATTMLVTPLVFPF